MKKPARVADNKMTMPYGDSVSAPSITLPDVQGYKKGQAAEASHRFHQRYEELETAMQELMTQAQYNDRLLNANIAFRPIIGQVYYLYNRDGEDFISMVSPEEWGESYMQTKQFIGAYKILADNVWIEVL
tara:strand:- start:828 stop:1217 length:390 start_codon:yes stop_codon:yes gene_type:complete